jgi:hypothetical protein
MKRAVRPSVWNGPTARPVRYLRFRIEGTKHFPDWHVSAGGPSKVFVDEIAAR